MESALAWELGALLRCNPCFASHNLYDLGQVIVPSELRALTLEMRSLAGIIPGLFDGIC